MKYITLCLILICLSSCALAQTDGYKPPPKEKDKIEEAASLAERLEMVYPGMAKEDLYGAFTHYQQKDYYKEGNEEWITFTGWMTEEPQETVTFYLKDGKVEGWDKGE